MKIKAYAKHPACDFLGPLEPRQLTDKVAVEVYEFLMNFVSDFLRRYGAQINRYNEQRYHRDERDLTDETPRVGADDRAP